MDTKKKYVVPSVKVIKIESSAILVGSEDFLKSADLPFDLERIEEEGFAD